MPVGCLSANRHVDSTLYIREESEQAQNKSQVKCFLLLYHFSTLESQVKHIFVVLTLYIREKSEQESGKVFFVVVSTLYIREESKKAQNKSQVKCFCFWINSLLVRGKIKTEQEKEDPK
jgi:hypothetical protein